LPSGIKGFTPIPIDSIKIGSRFRKDPGDIASLAEDIREIGLLHPIVINQNRKLICGLRRIEAFKSLVKGEIPAHIVNLDDIVKGEISENTQRKDFSLEEIIQIKKAVEPEIKSESKKRKLSGKPSAKFAEGSNESNNNNATSKNYSENQSCAQVAKYVSLYGKKISHATLAKAEKVYDAAQQDPTTLGQIWADLNSGKISPNKADREMQRTQTGPDETQPSTTTDNGKEVIAKTSQRTQLTPANQITEDGDDKIKQHQVREITEQKRTKEEQADIQKARNLNLSNVAVTWRFRIVIITFGEIKYHLVSLYPKIGDGGKVWFSGKLDKDTGKILSVKFGRIANKTS
jgi:ParB family transcriptional regulator, chromosome partitioning protein